MTTLTDRIQAADNLSRLLIEQYEVPVAHATQAAHIFNDLNTNLGRWSLLVTIGLSPKDAATMLNTLGCVGGEPPPWLN